MKESIRASASEAGGLTREGIARGLLLTPLVVGLLTSGAYSLIFWLTRTSGTAYNQVVFALIAGCYAAVVAIPITVLGVLPVVFWMRKRRAITAGRVLMLGFFLGAGWIVAIPLVNDRNGGFGYFPQTAMFSALSAVIGTAAAAVFWYVATRWSTP
jgi:hypothetical protein